MNTTTTTYYNLRLPTLVYDYDYYLRIRLHRPTTYLPTYLPTYYNARHWNRTSLNGTYQNSVWVCAVHTIQEVKMNTSWSPIGT